MRSQNTALDLTFWLNVLMAAAQQSTTTTPAAATGRATTTGGTSTTTPEVACNAANVTTILVQRDADSIARCRTFNGSIFMPTDAPGAITFDGLEVLNGAFVVRDTSGDTQLTSVTADNLRIITHALNVELLNGSMSFANLTSVQGDTVLSLEAFSSMNMQSLRYVNNSLALRDVRVANVSFPSLETVGYEISITGSEEMSVLWIPKLTSVGTYLRVIGNDRLGTVNLKSLQTVMSWIELSGSFSSLSFPSLRGVQSYFTVRSTSNIDDTCRQLASEIGTNPTSTIKGTLTCQGNLSLDQLSGGTESASGLSTDTKIGIGIGVSAGAVLIVFVAGYFYRRRRVARRKAMPVTKDKSASDVSNHEKPELSAQEVKRYELAEDARKPDELDGGGKHEMLGDSAVVELGPEQRHELEGDAATDRRN